MIEGIDVSHLNGEVDWPAVKAGGILFCFQKATQGHAFVDSRYHHNRRGARAAGVLACPYHYFTPSQDATAQARHFLEVTGAGKGAATALDLEEQGDLDPKEYQASVTAWLQTVEGVTGVKPILYTYPWFGQAFLGSGFTGHPLWIACYRPQPVTLCWPHYAVWQYDEHGHVAGVAGEVDRDRFNGDLAGLQALLGGTMP